MILNRQVPKKNSYYENYKTNEKISLQKRPSLRTKKNLDEVVKERRRQNQSLQDNHRYKRGISQKKMHNMSTNPFSNWIRGGYYGEKHKPDYLLFYIALILVVIGLVMVYSASSYKALLEEGNASAYFSKQFIFMLIGLVGMYVAFKIPIYLTERYAWIGFFISIIGMVAVMLFGVEVDGAVRWIKIAGVQFSPSDLAKLFGIIYFAEYLRRYNTKHLELKDYLTIFGIFLILPVLIVKEDLGTGLTLAGAMFVMMILSGIPIKYLSGTVGVGFLGIIGAIIVEPYRMSRITGFLDPFSPENIAGNGWQLVQSLYAFASGGLFGSGIGNGGQKLLYLPAMHTDFIFAVYAEEMGFIGAVVLLLLFLAFIIRGLIIASKLTNAYLSLVVAGLTSVIGIQALINMSVAIGVFPVTGITLPFISYGGTSLVVTMTIVGFILNLSQYTKEKKKNTYVK